MVFSIMFCPKHGDDVHDVNICFENPQYALARGSRAPKCDCGFPMQLHRYDEGCNRAKTKLLIAPAWYRQNYFPICEVCGLSGGGGARWVCPDQTCLSRIANPAHKQILQICQKCIHVKGIITCGVCKDETPKDYLLPCTQCDTPLCWKCHDEWSRMCKRLQNKEIPTVTCPFCRGRIDALYLEVPNNLRNAACRNDTMQSEVDPATRRRRTMLLQLAAAPF